MEREFSCFFTGHRWFSSDKTEWLKKTLRTKIKYLIEDKGVTDFITGGALGFDTLAAEAVIELKKTYPDITLHLYLPCYDSMSKWQPADQYRARIIMSESEKIYVTEGRYEDGCMRKRNRKMADDALYCIAYCERYKSGTGGTMRYAQSVGDYVENLSENIC